VEKASPTVAERAADVAGALAPHSAELAADIYALIVREIPQLRTDNRVLALLEASVAANVPSARPGSNTGACRNAVRAQSGLAQ
jgi:hypothetical protein